MSPRTPCWLINIALFTSECAPSRVQLHATDALDDLAVDQLTDTDASIPVDARSPSDALTTDGSDHPDHMVMDVPGESEVGPAVMDVHGEREDSTAVMDVPPPIRCPTPGELRCTATGNVQECAGVATGGRDWVTRLNCVSEGFVVCNNTPVAERGDAGVLYACGNACGGRGCSLSAQPDAAVPGTTCARYVCDGLCRVRSDHCDCRPVSAACNEHCQCASLRCPGGVCVPP